MSLELFEFFGTVMETVKKKYQVRVVARTEDEAKEEVQKILTGTSLAFQASPEIVIDDKNNKVEFELSDFKLPFNSSNARLQRKGLSAVYKEVKEQEKDEKNKEIVEKAERKAKENKAQGKTK